MMVTDSSLVDGVGYPAIESLLPHRGTMLLVDRLVHFESGAASVEFTPQCDAWYADAQGRMPAWFGIELMAQAVASHVAMVRRAQGLAPKLGALLGTRRLEAKVAHFASGVPLRIQVREEFRDESGLAAYACQIENPDAVVATATLKVYEPEDFASFLNREQA